MPRLSRVLFTLVVLILVTPYQPAYAGTSSFDDGYLLVPRIDVDGHGPLELLLRLEVNDGFAFVLETINETSTSVPISGLFDPVGFSIELEEVALSTGERYAVGLVLESQFPFIVFGIRDVVLLGVPGDQCDQAGGETDDVNQDDGSNGDSSGDGGAGDQDDASNGEPSEDGNGADGSGDDPGGEGSGDSSGASSSGDLATDANSLQSTQQLLSGDSLESSNGRYRLYLQADGNVVLRDQQTSQALWSSQTNGSAAIRLKLQGDGNLVLRSADDASLWSSKTAGSGATRLVLNSDGSLALYGANGPVWAVNGTGTGDTSGAGNTGSDSDNDSTNDADSGDDAGSGSSDEGGSGSEDGAGGDAGSDSSGNNAQGLIAMPIEVLGPAGTTKTVSFELGSTQQISHLYLRCNACGYHDIDLDKNDGKTKATVRINGGAAIPLRHFIEKGRVYGNADIQIIGGEADYGGIGGGFRTVRMVLPIDGLVAGANTLTFEHLDAEAPSIGFRIVELNLLRGGDLGSKVLAAAEFVEDDPMSWVPPRNSAADIADGRALWNERNRLYDIGLDNMDGQGNRQGPLDGEMRASCADCHASDGRDLKYFNFSNFSIVERSKFHEMTQAEGEKIASYIRSLEMPVVAQARPWHPTYQPGPGLDDRPVYEWAAGAGIDAVLDSDADMAGYLFPDGSSLNAVRAVVDRYDTLNFRELPINIPLPEWNQWLPIIHPDDAFDTSAAAILADYDGDSVGMPYYKKLYEDAAAAPTPDSIGALAVDIKRWLRRDLECSHGGLNKGEPMRGLNGAVLESLRLPAPEVTVSNCDDVRETPAMEPYEIAKRGLSAWSSVKMWEIVHGDDLEEEGLSVGRNVCSAGRCIDASERGWVVDGRNVFDRAPHFIGAGGGRKFFTQNPMLGIFESNTWYHLNMVINPGYRQTMPSHFAYTYSHVELLQQESDVDQGYRFWATMIKQRQLQTNGLYGVEAGLDLRTAQPYVYYGTARNTTKTDAQASVGQPLWGRLAQAMVEDLVADANHATAEDWANATQNRKVQARNSTNFSPCGNVCTFDLGEFQGRNTYRVIPKLREIGVAESAIQDLIDWGEKTWPNGPWDSLR